MVKNDNWVVPSEVKEQPQDENDNENDHRYRVPEQAEEEDEEHYHCVVYAEVARVPAGAGDCVVVVGGEGEGRRVEEFAPWAARGR